MNRFGRILYSLIGRIIPLLPGWRHERVRVLLYDGTGNVLLIRTWLSRQQWSLAGGGVNHGESREAACTREVYEETGLRINAADLRFLTTFRSERMQADLPVYMATTRQTTLPPLKFPYNFEIIDRVWYPLDALPSDVSEHTIQAIKLAFQRQN